MARARNQCCGFGRRGSKDLGRQIQGRPPRCPRYLSTCNISLRSHALDLDKVSWADCLSLASLLQPCHRELPRWVLALKVHHSNLPDGHNSPCTPVLDGKRQLL